MENVGAGIDTPTHLDAAGELLRRFLGPIVASLVGNEPFTRVWPPGGLWLAEASQIGGGASHV